jgi:hypothetical protein
MDYFTTVDKGRLHIAADQFYQGSINSYNNFVSRAYAALCRKSCRISINGKSFRLNTKSYAKFLFSLKVDLATAKLSQGFSTLPITPHQNRGFMRSHLQSTKALRLGRQMVQALTIKKDMQLAKKYIGQGAAVDNHFWYLEQEIGPKLCFQTHFSANLAKTTIQPFTATRYTPYLFAVASSQHAVKEFLAKIGANRDAKGEICTFSRTIMQCTNQVNVDPTVRTHIHVAPSRHGQRRPASRVTHTLGMDVVNTQILHFQDMYANRHHVTASANGQNVLFTPASNTNDVVNWSTSTQVGRVPIL